MCPQVVNENRKGPTCANRKRPTPYEAEVAVAAVRFASLGLVSPVGRGATGSRHRTRAKCMHDR